MKSNLLLQAATILVVLAAAAFWLVGNSRAATETPAYRVVRTDGKFEIRDYPALSLAGTLMDGGGMNDSFMRLFRYISGKNEKAEKIAMTAPVLVDASTGRRTMNFIMPMKTVEQGVPRPAGEDVVLGNLEAARFAVLRFGGGRSAEHEQRAAERLAGWLKAQNLAAKGPPLFAYYDPPWMPTFLRRNEVMVPIERQSP